MPKSEREFAHGSLHGRSQPKTVNPKERPKEGDRGDKRCAFVLDEKGSHDLGADPNEMWCSGCEFYICQECETTDGLAGQHDVVEHLNGI